MPSFNEDQGRSRALRVACVLAIVGVAGVALLYFLRSNPPPVSGTTVRNTPESLTASRFVVARQGDVRVTAAPAPASSAEPVADVVIDAVHVDKTEVCRGEEATVTIDARAADGDSAYLNFGVVGDAELLGPRIPLRLEKSLGSGGMKVYARGREGSAVLAEVPAISVKDCDAPFTLTIGYARNVNMPDRAWLSATVFAAKGSKEPPFEPVAYSWDFGDGTTRETSKPELEHSYEGRVQDTAYSYFLVSVKARDARGRLVRASRSLRFVNMGFDPTGANVNVFAAIDTTAPGEESISLYHGSALPVVIRRVAVRERASEPGPDERASAAENYDATKLLGFSEIPPGESLRVRSLAALRPRDASTVRVVEFEGESADGTIATGAFTLVAQSQPISTDSR